MVNARTNYTGGFNFASKLLRVLRNGGCLGAFIYHNEKGEKLVSRVSYRVTADKKLIQLDSTVNAPMAPKEMGVASPSNFLLTHFQKHQKGYTTAVLASVGLMYPVMASASTGSNMDGGKSLILLLQQASFWVGMGITIWGIVEAQLDFPGWRGRIAKGILGYIGILLVPLVFMELQNSLQVDVWTKIDKGMN